MHAGNGPISILNIVYRKRDLMLQISCHVNQILLLLLPTWEMYYGIVKVDFIKLNLFYRLIQQNILYIYLSLNTYPFVTKIRWYICKQLSPFIFLHILRNRVFLFNHFPEWYITIISVLSLSLSLNDFCYLKEIRNNRFNRKQLTKMTFS